METLACSKRVYEAQRTSSETRLKAGSDTVIHPISSGSRSIGVPLTKANDSGVGPTLLERGHSGPAADTSAHRRTNRMTSGMNSALVLLPPARLGVNSPESPYFSLFEGGSASPRCHHELRSPSDQIFICSRDELGAVYLKHTVAVPLTPRSSPLRHSPSLSSSFPSCPLGYSSAVGVPSRASNRDG